MNISIIGGDLRQLTLAGLLADDGHSIRIIGFDDNPPFPSEGVWESDVLILPIPASDESGTVYAPFSGTPLTLTAEKLAHAKLVLGGNIGKNLSSLLDAIGVKYIDYLKREELQIKNALPTAEGALEIAFSELPITLASSRCLVVGYGRIGKILAKLLASLGAEVTVSARKCSDLAWISVFGYTPIKTSGLSGLISGYDVIFNTAPAMVLDEAVLKHANPKTLIIDLASKPGGVDFSTAKELGLKVIWSLGLPGKVAPITSGEIIKEAIENILSETEV